MWLFEALTDIEVVCMLVENLYQLEQTLSLPEELNKINLLKTSGSQNNSMLQYHPGTQQLQFILPKSSISIRKVRKMDAI